MAIDRFSIYPASFVHAGGTLNLRQLDSQGLSANSSIKSIRPGGAIAPAAHILSTANPRASFVTCDIGTVLTAMAGNFHLACSGGHSMRFQKRKAGGTFETTNIHYVQTTSKGFLNVTGIGVDIDSVEGAAMELEYIPLSAAGENPITDTATGTITGVVPAFVGQFFLGGLYVNGVQILSLTRARAIPGNRFVSRRSDGGVFPRYDGSSINARDPMFDLTFLKADLPDAYSFFLTALGAQVDLYLQAGTTAADGRVSLASSAHIKLSLLDGSWGHDGLSVSGEDDATTTVRIMGVGSMVVEQDVAIPDV